MWYFYLLCRVAGNKSEKEKIVQNVHWKLFTQKIYIESWRNLNKGCGATWCFLGLIISSVIGLCNKVKHGLKRSYMIMMLSTEVAFNKFPIFVH